MASTRELRRRLRSVRSTKQITKAMELVAASKMRKASQATLSSRPYSHTLWEVLADLTSGRDTQPNHPLLTPREVKNVLVIAIASDRGLAGAYNAAVIRQVIQFAQRQEAEGKSLAFISLGKKIETALLRQKYELIQSYPLLSTQPTTVDLQPITAFVCQAFLEGQYDQVIVMYTNFISLLRQEAASLQLLPLQPPIFGAGEMERHQRDFLYEPNPEQVLSQLLPRILEVELYQAVLESLASEHSARRMAMGNATDNASTLIDDLTLTYNSLRQGAITQELAEITSGDTALI